MNAVVGRIGDHQPRQNNVEARARDVAQVDAPDAAGDSTVPDLDTGAIAGYPDDVSTDVAAPERVPGQIERDVIGCDGDQRGARRSQFASGVQSCPAISVVD